MVKENRRSLSCRYTVRFLKEIFLTVQSEESSIFKAMVNVKHTTWLVSIIPHSAVLNFNPKSSGLSYLYYWITQNFPIFTEKPCSSSALPAFVENRLLYFHPQFHPKHLEISIYRTLPYFLPVYLLATVIKIYFI